MKIFIAGSSHEDIPKKYINLADEISKLLANNNTLILGGIPDTIPSNSMMGIYNKNFKEKEFITVKKYEIENNPKNSTILYYTMDRTKTIYNKSDIILFLPGGIGTIAEITSMIEESRTNKNNKKIIIYNYDGFFNNIINWIDNGIKDNFISKEDISNYVVINNIEELKKEVER